MTLNDLYQVAKEQGKEKVCRFMRDMKRHGMKMRFYKGRNSYTGPAVTVENIGDIVGLTKIPINFDNMGRQMIVYPLESIRD